ncbi:MAG TPA: KAP family P-loop domain-containing protein [Cyanobacteria bacterium UBA8803]|nr:KAP family P-loop domain-containing protein [Cyanobacteria bacterium UBA9273]HBL60184.1 KAP family P-loop domain-containing protein [Cyanobacteria bacterium UBA8803]
MSVDLLAFFKATNPGDTLDFANPEDRKYYIDFSPVRGGTIIEELKENITVYYPDRPTCDLFTGHIGCGKSTELLRLKAELEAEGFHVIYFESSEDLEMADVDIADVLLAIARRISQSLENLEIQEPRGLKQLLKRTAELLQTEYDLSDVELGLPQMAGLPEVKVKADNQGTFSLAFGIGKITAKARADSGLRERLNQFLGPKKTELLAAINQELIDPAIAQLKKQGKKGLVVIVDNLDRIDGQHKNWGRPQQEYIFIDQAEYLQKFNCHLVYTMPLALKFADDYGRLTQRYSEEPKVLPMVQVQHIDGSDCEEGMVLLRQMVMARAFPDLEQSARLSKIDHVFDHSDSLDYLCRVSGGHVRDLLKLLLDWIKKDRKHGKLTRATLEAVIRARRNEMTKSIDDREWELLRHVQQRKKVSGDDGYRKLIHTRLVFEYCDRGESWFDINPILNDSKELLL